MPEITELSEREREILHLVATGAGNKEIAQKLYISTNTVKVHLRNIFTKIGATSRTEAAMYAVSVGMVEPVSAHGREGLSVLSGREAAWGAGREGSTALGPEAEKSARLRPSWRLAAVLVVMVSIGFAVFLALRDGGASIQASASPAPPSPPRWQARASMPTPRRGLALVAYENKIYAIGGENDGGITGVLERFDPLTNQWASLASKPVPVAEAGVGVIGGLIYVPGGRTTHGDLTSVLEVYDPLENHWERRSPMPVALSAYAIATFEGNLYLFGGWDGLKFRENVYLYEPSQDRWSEKTAMGSARGYAGAAIAGGKVYVIGGYDGEKALAVNEIYLPERDNGQGIPWISGAPLPAGRYAMGVASIADIILVIGGLDDGEQNIEALEYSPQVDEWQMIERPALENWAYLGLVSLETHLYALGGLVGDIPNSQTLAYQAIYTISIPLVR